MPNAVLAKLRALVTGRPVEECELCARTISAEHEHVLEADARRVFCACQSCAKVFAEEQPRRGARYLRVERRATRLSELELGDVAWADMGIPAGLAFFTVRSRTAEVVATFPGRAGLIEAFVPSKAWTELERRFPVVREIRPEVEALLVRRTLRHHDYFHVSVDHCYELAGLLRDSEALPSPAELPLVQAFFTRLDEQTDQRRHSRRPGL
jgi:hypothetical protein